MGTFLQFIRNLGTGQLIMVVVAGAFSIGFFGLVIGQLGGSNMTVLYSDLDPSASGEIIQRLEAQGVDYETDGGGTIVRVPQADVDRLRLSFASEGISGNIVGKEIFDQDSGFGRTSFELEVNYVRAIEGELARTIRFIKAISDVRVHIVMPERRPFEPEAAEPSASIMIQARQSLAQAQVRSIQSLVASAVPGLSPDLVTVTDSSGRLLSDGASDASVGGLKSIEDARIARERMYRERIENLIGSHVGRDGVRAEVSILMTTARQTENRRTFDPNNQVVRAQTIVEESSVDSNNAGGAVTAGNNTADASFGGGQNGSQSDRTEERTDFENSLTETVTIREPGEIERINVAVLVDSEKLTPAGADGNPTPDQQLAEMRGLVEGAIPYDSARGDVIQVQAMQFAPPPAFEEADTPFNLFGFNKEDVFQIVQVTSLSIFAILLLLTVVRPIVARIVEAIPQAVPVDPNAQIEAETHEPPALARPDDGSISQEILAAAAAGDAEANALVRQAQAEGKLQLDNMNTESRIDVAQVEGRIQDSAVKKVADIVRSNPDDSVAIIRQWLYAD